MEYWGVISLCFSFVGVAAIFLLVIALGMFQKKGRERQAREVRAGQAAEIVGQTGWRFSATATPDTAALVNIVHKAVAITEGDTLSTSWPQITDNFFSGTKNNVDFTIFDHTYYKGNYKSRRGYRPTVCLTGIQLRHPDIQFPEFNIAPKQPDRGMLADFMEFSAGTSPETAWSTYSIRSPEAKFWPPNFDQVLQKLESTGIVLAAGNRGTHCVMFKRNDSRAHNADELQHLIEKATSVTLTLLSEMRKTQGKGTDHANNADGPKILR